MANINRLILAQDFLVRKGLHIEIKNTLNSFKLFIWNRKYWLLGSDDAIFLWHSCATVFKNGDI